MLTQIVNKVSLLDSMEDVYAKNIIEEIKIFVYKFNTYCKETEIRSSEGHDNGNNKEDDMDELIEDDR